MNNNRTATASSIGAAVWLTVSLVMLLWVAFTVSTLLHTAAEITLRALQN